MAGALLSLPAGQTRDLALVASGVSVAVARGSGRPCERHDNATIDLECPTSSVLSDTPFSSTGIDVIDSDRTCPAFTRLYSGGKLSFGLNQSIPACTGSTALIANSGCFAGIAIPALCNVIKPKVKRPM